VTIRKGTDLNIPLIVKKIERWAIDRLTAFGANARTHSDEQISQIAASIEEFGFVNPILVGGDGVIVAGHARLRAAQKLGMREVPVIVLGHLTEIQRRALVIADNQLALNAAPRSLREAAEYTHKGQSYTGARSVSGPESANLLKQRR